MDTENSILNCHPIMAGPLNILLLMIDALRADHFGTDSEEAVNKYTFDLQGGPRAQEQHELDEIDDLVDQLRPVSDSRLRSVNNRSSADISDEQPAEIDKRLEALRFE